jgi:tetratricopeptide (TPR) repeat protein
MKAKILCILAFTLLAGPTPYSQATDEETGSYEKDAEAYKKIIATDPSNVEAHYQLALTYHHKLGNYYRAVDAYRRVIRIDPEGPRAPMAYHNLGVLYHDHGRTPEAIEAYKKAIDLEPKATMAHSNLGIIYFQRGDRDSAFKEYLFLKYRDKELADKLYDFMHGKKVEGVRRESW